MLNADTDYIAMAERVGLYDSPKNNAVKIPDDYYADDPAYKAMLDKPQKKKASLKPLSIALQDLKPMEWIIKKILPAKSVIFLHAPPKVGKTFIGIDWAMSIATGEDWHGKEIKQPGTVLYISGEGNNNILKRFQGWLNHNDVSADDANLLLSQRVFRLPTDQNNIIEAVISAMQEHGYPNVSSIILDTYIRTLDGDENSSVDAAKYIAAADEIKERFSCAVVVIHHTNRNETRMNGSNTLLKNADCVYLLDGDSDDMQSVKSLTCTEMKDAAKPLPIGFMFKRIELPGIYADPDCPEDGWESTLVPVATDAPPKVSKGSKAAKGKNPKAAMVVLHSLIDAQRRNLELSGHNPDQAQVMLTHWIESCKNNPEINERYLSPSAFLERIQKPLIEQKLIKCLNGYVEVIK